MPGDGHLPRYYPVQLIQYINSDGLEQGAVQHLFPQLSPSAGQARALPLHAESRAAFLAGNARGVFRLP